MCTVVHCVCLELVMVELSLPVATLFQRARSIVQQQSQKTSKGNIFIFLNLFLWPLAKQMVPKRHKHLSYFCRWSQMSQKTIRMERSLASNIFMTLVTVYLHLKAYLWPLCDRFVTFVWPFVTVRYSDVWTDIFRAKRSPFIPLIGIKIHKPGFLCLWVAYTQRTQQVYWSGHKRVALSHSGGVIQPKCALFCILASFFA